MTALTEIPKNELWQVDIKLYIYDKLKNYVPIIEILGTDWICLKTDECFQKLKNNQAVIWVDYIAWRTNELGIRSELIQIDIYAHTMEDAEKLKAHVVDLFNRENWKWIRSKLNKVYDWRSKNKWARIITDFHFIYKDMKF